MNPLPDLLFARCPDGHSEKDCACQAEQSLNWKPNQQQDASPFIRLPINAEYSIFLYPGARPALLSQKAQRYLDETKKGPSLLEWLKQNSCVDCTAQISQGEADIDDCAPAQSGPLTIWLHLTDRCNLGCDYCYLPHKPVDMSPEIGRTAIEAAFRSARIHGFRAIKIKYAGGEPLLRFPLAVELHRYAQFLAQASGITLQGVVLSNGTLLTSEIARQMLALDMQLMLSLDGLGRYHDAHRRYATGRGSFADVAAAVDLALDCGLIPRISVTVSGRTAAGLPQVVAWILERDLPFSLNFYRENPFSASQPDLRLDEEKIIAGMLAAFKVIEDNLPRRPLLGSLVDRANLMMSHVHTCGAGQNYLVFDPQGRVAKCQMQIHAPVTESRVHDPLSVVRADRGGVQNVSVEIKEGCRRCPWRYWCAGGCPLETFRVTGRYDVQSPHCHIYQVLFPQALRLEGWRLLKYQDDASLVEKRRL